MTPCKKCLHRALLAHIGMTVPEERQLRESIMEERLLSDPTVRQYVMERVLMGLGPVMVLGIPVTREMLRSRVPA